MVPTSTTGRRARPVPGRLFGTIATLVLLAGLAACSSEEPEREFLGVQRITVAMHNDLPGLSYSSNYDRSGLDFLMFQHIEEEIDVDFSEPVDVSSGDRVTQLIQRKADMTIASFSITADRMDEIDFVGPYLKTRQGFLVGPDAPASSGWPTCAAARSAPGRAPPRSKPWKASGRPPAPIRSP
ncbi:transporter substrate-binding domain-containing protein [Streptomyces sp. MT29]|nr:transporter substrate-binding domain-containing protein [Streptomyces sp. MT29]